jgi:hypothetical protein
MELRGALDRFQWTSTLPMKRGPDTRCSCDTKLQLQPSPASGSQLRQEQQVQDHPLLRPGRQVSPWQQHITCNCDDTDVDTMYCMCCITTGNSPTSLSVTTLFDTGANLTSFVNRQAAAWIESRQSPQALGKRKHSPAPSENVSFAGTSQSSPIYASVVFNLTFFNEVTRSNESLYRLHANVIDSCIDIIVGRPVIREHYLIQKIPHYFDETTSVLENSSMSTRLQTSHRLTRLLSSRKANYWMPSRTTMTSNGRQIYPC